jgi:hypothetical protein
MSGWSIVKTAGIIGPSTSWSSNNNLWWTISETYLHIPVWQEVRQKFCYTWHIHVWQ